VLSQDPLVAMMGPSMGSGRKEDGMRMVWCMEGRAEREGRGEEGTGGRSQGGNRRKEEKRKEFRYFF